MTVRRGGAPRSEAARIAILEATARQVVERGFAHMTVEGIAADAHVGKQTIYRWWSDKSELVAECMVEGYLLADHLTVSSTADLRDDLRRALTAQFAFADDPAHASLLRSLIAAATDNPGIADRVRQALSADGLLRRRLDQGVADGDLPPGSPTRTIAEAIAGAFVLRVLLRTPPGNVSDEVERLLDAVLGAAVARPE